MSELLSEINLKSDNSMPWVEKYRPNTFDNIVLDPLNRDFFNNIIEKGHFPNLIFYGPPGTGKTTTIINVIQEYQSKYTRINKETVIHLNASDERGVDIIRTQIHQFVKSCHIFETGCKFVILDEVDYMTKNAQQALTTLLQMSNRNVRFCLICNYISKIDESLQREFICVRFNQLPPIEIRRFILKVAESEQLSISSDEIDLLMANYNSDIRSMINFMQSTYFGKHNNITLKSISSKEWGELTRIMTEENKKGAEQYVNQISSQYNLNKKQILVHYMNYILRKYTHFINNELMLVFQNVTHSSDDMSLDDLVSYFVTNVNFGNS